MAEDFFSLNESKFLHKIPYDLSQKLSEAMVNNWKEVLNNIPKNKIGNVGEYRINKIFKPFETQGKNPAEGIFMFGTYGVKLRDLVTSFEKIKFEEGLKIVCYPEKELKTKARFPDRIYIAVGKRLELFCESSGFPFPKHFYYKEGENKISTQNPFIIENVKYVSFIRVINFKSMFLYLLK